MLTCRDVADRASAFVDDELGLRERLAIRIHLVLCVHCRRFVRQLRSFVASMGLRAESNTEAATTEFVENVMQALDRAQPPSTAPKRPDEA